MVEASAEEVSKATPTESEPKSPAELEKDKAATELLKELEAEESATESKPEPVKPKEAAKDEEESEEGENAEGDEEDATGSQPDKATKKGKRGFKRRQARLVQQREDAKASADKNAQALTASEEEKKLLRMKIAQLEGQTKPLTEPDPDTFDGGELDPEYAKAKRDFDDHRIKRLVSDQVAEATKQGDQTATKRKRERDLQQKQEEHWKNADEFGADDYDAAEEKAIKVMGADMVNNIIDYFPGESHKAIFYLGLDANADEAEDLAELFESGQAGLVKGVAEMGRILERIKSNPIKTSITPDPDDETEGSAASPQEALQLKLDKLREDASKSGRSDGMKRILAFKRKAKARGITLG